MNKLIKENVNLGEMTTFKFGGDARYFAVVDNESEVKEAVSFALNKDLPIFIFAGGSNLIVSSNGFNGLVIKPNFKLLETDDKFIRCGSAVTMKELVDESIERSLKGLEWAGGLPGTVGGAVRGNAGAFGGEIKDSVVSVESIDLKTDNLLVRDNSECQFIYRGSYYKTNPGELIITVKFELSAGNKSELRAIADDHIRYRHEKHPMDAPNSGSIFKNTPLEKVKDKYMEQFKDVVKNDPFPVIPTAKIIADAGLAGRTVGGAQISTKHTNYIINTGEATAEDVVRLIDEAKRVVSDKFEIELEVEPELLGF